MGDLQIQALRLLEWGDVVFMNKKEKTECKVFLSEYGVKGVWIQGIYYNGMVGILHLQVAFQNMRPPNSSATTFNKTHFNSTKSLRMKRILRQFNS